MENNILIINGSLRIDGNTDILVKEIIAGTEPTDVNINLAELRNKKIADCIGCYACSKESKCSLSDDMIDIRNKVEQADLLIFASPLYWGAITGLMKSFIDRLFYYYHSQNKALVSGKKAIVVTVMHQKSGGDEEENLTKFYDDLCAALGIKIINKIFFDGLMEKGAVLNKQEHIEQASFIGKNLKKLIEQG